MPRSGLSEVQNRAALLGRLDHDGAALPPRLDEIDATVPDASGHVATVTVMRVSFPEAVFFDFDRDVLWLDAAAVCDLVADSIRRDVPGVQVTVVGHTDAIGSDAYNLDLSRRRALAVMQALVARGVAPSVLSTVALGKRQPIASDHTPAGRAENRRVEFFVSPSLQANLAVIAAQPIQAADLPADTASDSVQVLRPETAATPDAALTLAAVGSIALATPTGRAATPLPATPDAGTTSPLPPLAPVIPRQPEGLPVAQPAAPPPTPAPLAETAPAIPRSLAPQYAPRVPGPPLSY